MSIYKTTLHNSIMFRSKTKNSAMRTNPFNDNASVEVKQIILTHFNRSRSYGLFISLVLDFVTSVIFMMGTIIILFSSWFGYEKKKGRYAILSRPNFIGYCCYISFLGFWSLYFEWLFSNYSDIFVFVGAYISCWRPQNFLYEIGLTKIV